MPTTADVEHLAEDVQRLRVSWRKMNNFTNSFATIWFARKQEFDAGQYPGWTFAFWLGQKVGLPEASITKMLYAHSAILAGEHQEAVEAAVREQKAQEAQAKAAEKARQEQEKAIRRAIKDDARRSQAAWDEYQTETKIEPHVKEHKHEPEAPKTAMQDSGNAALTVPVQPASPELTAHCEQCNKSMEKKRKTKRFCSNACRAAHNNARVKPPVTNAKLADLLAEFRVLEQQQEAEIKDLERKHNDEAFELKREHHIARGRLCLLMNQMVAAGQAGIDPETSGAWRWVDWCEVFLGRSKSVANREIDAYRLSRGKRSRTNIDLFQYVADEADSAARSAA